MLDQWRREKETALGWERGGGAPQADRRTEREQREGHTHKHGGLERPFPAQDVPFELERAQEFDHICANRKVRDIIEGN